jgi:hypothetical protein
LPSMNVSNIFHVGPVHIPLNVFFVGCKLMLRPLCFSGKQKKDVLEIS